jgi:regulation of enolase protein 1 (concanavalin A-like superfamily)
MFRSLLVVLSITGCEYPQQIDSQVATDSADGSELALLAKDSASAATLRPRLFWKPRRDLVWDDFQAAVPADATQSASSFVGFTDPLPPTLNPDDSVTIEGARAYFVPSRSWVRAPARSAALRAHEQGHFDLEEAVARSLRAQLEQLAHVETGTDLEASTADSAARFEALATTLHGDYDDDTRRGRDATVQAVWDAQIADMLAEPTRVSFRDEFEGTTLSDGWAWTRENSATWSLTGDALHIDLEYGDLWQGWTNNCRNMLLRPPPLGETFTVEAHMTTSLVANINQALIVLYGDDDNYLRYGLVNLGSIVLDDVHELGGGTYHAANAAYGADEVYLRMIDDAGAVTLEYSADGGTWYTHDTIASLDFTVTAVGIVAFDGSEPPSDSTVDYYDFEARMGTD